MGINGGLRLLKAFKWSTHRPTWRITAVYRRQDPLVGPVSSLNKLIRSVKSGARSISSGKMNSDDFGVGQESSKMRKGHLAVYVGVAEEDTCRVLVPVSYFNHPLFVELLKEAEEVYGFDHQVGIQIPCRITELKEVQRKIAVACGGGSHRRWRS